MEKPGISQVLDPPEKDILERIVAAAIFRQ